MQAQRFITEVTTHSVSDHRPEGFKNDRVEIIVLGLDGQEKELVERRRHPNIAGRVQILGNTFSSLPGQIWGINR